MFSRRSILPKRPCTGRHWAPTHSASARLAATAISRRLKRSARPCPAISSSSPMPRAYPHACTSIPIWTYSRRARGEVLPMADSASTTAFSNAQPCGSGNRTTSLIQSGSGLRICMSTSPSDTPGSNSWNGAAPPICSCDGSRHTITGRSTATCGS